MSFYYLYFEQISGTLEDLERLDISKKYLLSTTHTVVRSKMHTQNNGSNMQMSSNCDQSGTEPSFLPPQRLPFHVL